MSLAQIAETLSTAAGLPTPTCRPFPEERKAIDIGSYHTDSTRIGAELGWRPATSFATGAARTLAYYRENLPRHLDPANPNPQCKLEASKLARA